MGVPVWMGRWDTGKSQSEGEILFLRTLEGNCDKNLFPNSLLFC